MIEIVLNEIDKNNIDLYNKSIDQSIKYCIYLIELFNEIIQTSALYLLILFFFQF